MVPFNPCLVCLQAVVNDEVGQNESVELTEDKEPPFPQAELAKLDELISRPRWVVPVLPKGELEVLLEAAIELCKKGQFLGVFILVRGVMCIASLCVDVTGSKMQS